MIPDNFADHPKTIGELRSDRTDSCGDWTPRDALIAVLRLIDNGMKCDALVVSYCEQDDGKDIPRYRMAASDARIAVGLLAYTMHQIVA
jgi:hypothetical protein